MRPIHLSIAGLHSFREKQEINFEALCAGGVFGIFGPTGSGKSTILDAITLALYGKVERATNNTQGIMNHAVDQLSVSFTFQLGKKEHEKRFRVERTFKRSSELGLRTSICRLVESDLAGEEQVLADKEREVTQTIQQILGLTIDDFTRAVVLPQGKFAEFLALKGAERRQMLQRLFHLEQYGDRLNNNLNQRLKTVQSAVDQVVAEQLGLGDASEESLANLKKNWQLIEKQVAEQKVILQQLEKDYTEQKQVWHWQAELQSVEDQLAQLKAKEEEILLLEKQLSLALGAEQLKPYAEEWRTAEESFNKWQNQTVLLQKELLVSQESYQLSESLYAGAQKKREIEEPKLLVHAEQLKQARKIELSLEQMGTNVAKLKSSIKQLDRELNEQAQLFHKEQVLYEKALQRQQELKNKLSAIQVSSELRVALRKASTAKQDINHQEQSLQELSARLKKQLGQLQMEELQYGQLSRQTAQLQEQIAHYQYQITELSERFHRLTDEIEVVAQMISEEINREKEALEQERQQKLAYHLAHVLQVGQACPVCGSTEHPQPARDIEEDFNQEERKNKLSHLEISWQAGREKQTELAKYIFQLEQLAQAFEEVAPIKVRLLNKGGLKQAHAHLQDKEQSILLQELIAVSHSYVQELLQVEQNARGVLRKWHELQVELKQAELSLHSKEKEILELEASKRELARILEQEKKKWQDSFPDFSFSKIAENQAQIDARDKEATELSQRLETSIGYIAERESNINRLQNEMNQLQLRAVELQTNYTAQEKQMKQLQDQLTEFFAQEVPLGHEESQEPKMIDTLIKQVSAVLLDLKEREQQSYNQFMKQQQILQAKEKEYSIAQESLKQAQLRRQAAQDKWQEAIQESHFTQIEQVFKALLPRTERLLKQEQISNYREQEKESVLNQAKLKEQLQGKVLTLAVWQEIQSKVQEAQVKREELLQASARAKRDWEEMDKRHGRYQELEKTRHELEHKAEQLSKLQALLRGNSFVEFIATEQLLEVSRDASYRLGQLTRQRYALEVDSSLGFVIRDDHNAGFKRPVSSLSGGETFLTSLALALALSAQIQLRGEYPLEFFFLDEGFGTLDQALLDTVISALEKLHTAHLSVGVISHVPELRARIPRQLIVEPESAERGSTVRIEP